MSRIIHPTRHVGTFTDRLGDVVFHDGVADVDLSDKPNLRDAYRLHGYKVQVPPIITPTQPEREFPGTDSTKAELLAYAADHDIDLTGATNNPDRLELIRSHPLPEA